MTAIYGHPAPCLVTPIDGGPTVVVEPLRFIAVSELPLRGGSPGTAQPGGAPSPALPGEQMRAASTPRSRDGVPLSASSLHFPNFIHTGLNTA